MPAKRRTLTATTSPRAGVAPPHHFFVSSAATWRVGYDVADLIAAMRKEGLPFNVWLVPGPKEGDYQIEMFAPQVEGAKFLAFYGVDARPTPN